ncbi:unnamed protein product [Euphydryas editha]|uniref:Uncharacterized protein n=1 Tax=Euphydryas editha TaxID=104508 RepID=A0AAU9UXL8_EUPED|nr:unnamed protein product [Euphydryas editha]
MSNEIQNLIQLKVLEPAPLTPSFISPLFIIPKSNGKCRTIFNLKALNQNLEKTLVDTATMLLPAQVGKLHLEAWLISGGMP